MYCIGGCLAFLGVHFLHFGPGKLFVCSCQWKATLSLFPLLITLLIDFVDRPESLTKSGQSKDVNSCVTHVLHVTHATHVTHNIIPHCVFKFLLWHCFMVTLLMGTPHWGAFFSSFHKNAAKNEKTIHVEKIQASNHVTHFLKFFLLVFWTKTNFSHWNNEIISLSFGVLSKYPAVESCQEIIARLQRLRAMISCVVETSGRSRWVFPISW